MLNQVGAVGRVGHIGAGISSALETFRYHLNSSASVIGDGSKGAPYKYPSDVPELVDGDSLGIAGGSAWDGTQEGIQSNASRLRIGRYGAGANPKFDGGRVMANASFTKTGGRTNVYQFTTTRAAGSGRNHNVFEAGDFLTAAADLTACDNTAGSYYIADHNAANPVIYIHPKGSTNATSDGKLYEYTGADTGLLLRGSRCSIAGIDGGRHALSTSLTVGDFGRLTDCNFFKTNRHAAVPGKGSIVARCTFSDMYYGPQDGRGFLVFFSEDFDSERCIAMDCSFSVSVEGRGGLAIDAHHGSSGKLAAVDVLRCQFSLVDTGVGVQHTLQLNVDRGVFLEVGVAVAPFCDAAMVTNCTQTNVTRSGNNQAFIVLGNAGQSVTALNNSASLNKGQSFFRGTANGQAVILTGNTYRNASWGGFPIQIIFMRDGTLSVHGNDLQDSNGQYAMQLEDTGGTVIYDGDDNTWAPATQPTGGSLTWLKPDLPDGGVKGLAAWQANTGQDLNSIAA